MTKTIMIVDESPCTRTVVGSALRGEGYTVIEATNGQDAISKLTGQTVNLIISDVHMPVMDGITFVKNAKAMDAYRCTPIIILTTESDEARKREGWAAGAKAWMVKPFRPEKMLGAVHKLCLP